MMKVLPLPSLKVMNLFFFKGMVDRLKMKNLVILKDGDLIRV